MRKIIRFLRRLFFYIFGRNKKVTLIYTEQFQKYLQSLLNDIGVDVSIIENSPIENGNHVTMLAKFSFKRSDNIYDSNVIFHLNLFKENNEWVFVPVFDVAGMIANVFILHEELEEKQRILRKIAAIILTKQIDIKEIWLKLCNN